MISKNQSAFFLFFQKREKKSFSKTVNPVSMLVYANTFQIHLLWEEYGNKNKKRETKVSVQEEKKKKEKKRMPTGR